ncbi:MAG: hypothetical protein QNJ98_12080 [Planctomycetota bacterium]|nr:hypothetical protein [Planctomycetota bacterium]
MKSNVQSASIKPYRTPERELLPGALAARQGDKLVPVSDVDTRLSDGYLRLAAHILLRSQQQACRTIGVIGARDGEGTTTAAMNLAVCLGRTRGRSGRVLLVDGDARGRDLTRMVHGAKGTGRHPMLVSTAFEGVDLMTAPDATDALSIYDPAAWAQTLHELSSRYAQIVIDCPSILDNPEGVVLRECAEELVLVVNAGETRKEDVDAALGTVGRRVLGVIVSDPTANAKGGAR